MEEVECFRCSGVDIDINGGKNSKMKNRLNERDKFSCLLMKMWKSDRLSIDAQRGMYEGIVSPTLLYGSEIWATGYADSRQMEVMERKCMRAMCGVSIMDG
jgi:hypothetical protein